MQNRTDEFEAEIMSSISMELIKWRPRDKEYAIQHLNTKLSRLTPYIKKDKVLEHLYKQYRLGSDIFQILDDEYFYNTLPYHKYPHLFKIGEPTEIPISKVKKKATKAKSKHAFDEPPYELEFFAMPPEITLIKEQIPIVKKTLTEDIKKYIFFMEFKNWIEQNGLTIPQVKENESIRLAQETASSDIELQTIENYLKHLMVRNKPMFNDENYKKLIKILYDFFKHHKETRLPVPIKVKKGSIKQLALALGDIYRELSENAITYEYLMLGKNNISLFSEYDIKPDKITNSTLYKYYCG
jgi:hypothetical protein